MRLRVKHNLSKIAITYQEMDSVITQEQISTKEYLNRLFEESVETDNRWDLPYHYYINSVGEIYEGRNVIYSGESITDFDPRGFVIICLLTSDSQEKSSIDQLKAKNDLIDYLTNTHGVDTDDITHLSNPDSGSQEDPDPGTENNGGSLIHQIVQ